MIWKAEFDAYFIEALKTIEIDGKPVFVTYSNPESEGNEDEGLLRPAISFYMYDILHDIDREESQSKYIKSQTSTTATLADTPIPVKLCYQFTIHADYVEHHDKMLYQFLNTFPFRGYITVIDPNTQEESFYDLFHKAQNVRNSKVNKPEGTGKPERTYRTEFRYHLMCEQYPMREETTPTVQEVLLTIEGLDS